MAKNKWNQYVSVNPISKKITKTLQEIAEDVAIRVKPLVRDELEEQLRHDVYASYRPATEKGKEIEEYNKTHKHQKARLYHHTGILVRNIHGVIDGDYVKIEIGEERYDNGKTAREVYDYLKYGTSDKAKSDVYPFNNGTQFSSYISQDPHNFEARTRTHMNTFLEQLHADLKNNPKKYSKKYTDAVRARFIAK